MGYEFPNTREALWQLVEHEQYAGEQGVPYFQLTVDFQQRLPAVQIIMLTPTEAFLSRVDRVQVDVYAEGELAQRYAEAFKERIVGENLDVEGVGLLDTIASELAPHDVPYPSDRVNVSSAVYRVTTRPV